MDLEQINEERFYELASLQIQNDNNKDLEEIEKLKTEIKKYDIYDFLTSVAALNLIPQNQAKSVILNCIISATISIPLENVNFSNKMSINKFKQIIKSFQNLSIRRMIDPPEFPFIQKLIYYKNYSIFMGVSNISIEDIQMFLNVLRDNYSQLKTDTRNKLDTDISLLLEISTYISQKIDFCQDILTNINKAK